MRPFFDAANVGNAIAGGALPALEHLADHPDRLQSSLDRRFERDDPPPYASSSEDEAEVALHHPVLAGSEDAALEKFLPRVSEPLDDSEVRGAVLWLQGTGVYAPSWRYKLEADREDARVTRFALHHRLDPAYLWKGSRADQRRAILVRRNIKRRWQRLGIWNPEWGIPGRAVPQPNDVFESWQWVWHSSSDRGRPLPLNHPVRRALELRRNLAYLEHAPPPPRSRLKPDSSIPESESFITSRPWFVYELEAVEFRARRSRIPVGQRGHRGQDEDDPVTSMWKERGDWEPEWKWRHESPEPEDEDLTPLLTDEMDYTPSEAGALDAIPPPSRPSSPWWRGDDSFRAVSASVPDYPGPPESHEAPPAADEREDQGVPEDNEPPAAANEPEDQDGPEPEELPPNPPPRRRGRPRKQPRPADVAEEPTTPPPPPPPPRRSARIAAKSAAPAVPPPPAAASRPPARTRKARGHPASPPPPPPRNPSPAATVPKKRGRPRKTQDGAVAKPAAAPTANKTGRKSGTRAATAVKRATENAVDGAAAARKRPRGRPRRTG